MKTTFSSPRLTLLKNSFLTVGLVVATTLPLVLIGRDTLGEAVIAVLYLVPVAWSATRGDDRRIKRRPGRCTVL